MHIWHGCLHELLASFAANIKIDQNVIEVPYHCGKLFHKNLVHFGLILVIPLVGITSFWSLYSDELLASIWRGVCSDLNLR